jgi:hypothetical protein
VSYSVSSISFTDASGPVLFSNTKGVPGSWFRNWTPAPKPVGPEAEGLGTGRIFRYNFRTDSIVTFDIEAIPATELDKANRLMLHLINGGKVALAAADHALGSTYAACTMVKGSWPTLQLSDSENLEYTMSFVLRADVAEPTDPFFDIAGAVPGMVLWLKPETLITLETESTIGTWPDSSGLGNHATQTNSNKPVYRTGQMNGVGSVHFQGGSCLQVPPSMWTGKTAGERFVVQRTDLDPASSDATGGHMFLGNDVSHEAYMPASDGLIYDNFGTTLRKIVGNVTPVLTAPHIYRTVSTSSEWTATIDGTDVYTTATNTVGFSTVHQRIGGGYPGSPIPDQKYVGYFSEIMCWGRKLSDAERDDIVTAYLAAKYTITVV